MAPSRRQDHDLLAWPVKTVAEGIEILTGQPYGQRQEDGSFEEGTISYLVDKRLSEMAEGLKGFLREDENRVHKKSRKETLK